MDFDGFVSFMARYNSTLYPTHDNLWMRIHLINPASFRPSTAKAFKRFKLIISKAVKNLSQADLEKLISMKDGTMRPHPNTFILKKFGIPTSMYETIRYAAFNHARHISVSPNLPPVPRVQKIESIQDEMMNMEKTITSKISQKLEEIEPAIVDRAVNESYSAIARELDKAIKSIKENERSNLSGGFTGGLIGGALVSLIATIINNSNKPPQLPIDDLLIRISNIEDEIRNLETTLLYLKNTFEPFLNLEDGYNYLKAFGVPITKEDWDKLSDQMKRSWSPFVIKPPLTKERKESIARAIKQNEPPAVTMCYDIW